MRYLSALPLTSFNVLLPKYEIAASVKLVGYWAIKLSSSH